MLCINRLRIICVSNRPFPSSLVPRSQNESKCETFHMKMSSACSFIFMQIKVIFIRMVSHLDNKDNSEMAYSTSEHECSLAAVARDGKTLHV